MSAERWKPVVGSGGLYEISDMGRIRSLHNWRGDPGPRFIYIGTGKRGHQEVWMRYDGARHARYIHQLVIEAFVGPRPEGMEVRHLDGDPKNNRVDNLAYGTHSENERDKVRHGTHRNAGKTHCPHGHEYTPENTLVTTTASGSGRACRTCIRESSKRRSKTPAFRAKRNAYMREYNRRKREAA